MDRPTPFKVPIDRSDIIFVGWRRGTKPSVPIDCSGHHFTTITAVGGCRGTKSSVPIDVLLASDRLNCRRVLRDEPRRCIGVPILANPKSFCCWIPWVAFLDPRYGGLNFLRKFWALRAEEGDRVTGATLREN
ncbi:MAG: hypothetical protein F6K42_38325 [Leptolyngbya sp. SIO1D8]|nr:hypothetical protein [Leptolyngbya sp. SIO1D8]